jgi:pimeloyl-ACP methyl ester carboxylesterase
MTTDRGRIGRWRDARAEKEFNDLQRALEREAWSSVREQGWEAEPSELDVETRFGTTHAYRWPGAGQPIVLLHGAGTTSLMWTPLLAHLVGRRVYAVDVLGDPGRGVQRASLSDADDMSSWLEEVLDGLQLDRVQLIGASYGGWVAMHFAMRARARVGTLTLLEPVVERVRPFFFVHGIVCGIALVMPAPIRRWAARRLRMNGLAIDDRRVMRWAFLGQAKYRRGAPKFVPFTDAALASITAPTLVMLGEKSQVHFSRRVGERIRSLMPHVDVVFLPGAGHSLPVDQAEDIGPRIQVFLDGQVAAARRPTNTGDVS